MGPLTAAKAITFILTRDRALTLPFYADILGLRLLTEDEFGAMFDLNGTDGFLEDRLCARRKRRSFGKLRADFFEEIGSARRQVSVKIQLALIPVSDHTRRPARAVDQQVGVSSCDRVLQICRLRGVKDLCQSE